MVVAQCVREMLLCMNGLACGSKHTENGITVALGMACTPCIGCGTGWPLLVSACDGVFFLMIAVGMLHAFHAGERSVMHGIPLALLEQGRTFKSFC